MTGQGREGSRPPSGACVPHCTTGDGATGGSKGDGVGQGVGARWGCARTGQAQTGAPTHRVQRIQVRVPPQQVLHDGHLVALAGPVQRRAAAILSNRRGGHTQAPTHTHRRRKCTSDMHAASHKNLHRRADVRPTYTNDHTVTIARSKHNSGSKPVAAQLTMSRLSTDTPLVSTSSLTRSRCPCRAAYHTLNCSTAAHEAGPTAHSEQRRAHDAERTRRAHRVTLARWSLTALHESPGVVPPLQRCVHRVMRTPHCSDLPPAGEDPYWTPTRVKATWAVG